MKINYINRLTKIAVAFASLVFVCMSSCKDKPDDGGDDDDITVDKISTYIAFNYEVIDSRFKKHEYAAIWHDGEIEQLSPDWENVYVSGLFIYGDDVYAAGSCDGAPVYWKNGTQVDLFNGRAATDIFVKDGVIYVCGYNATNFGDQAMLWIDGVPMELEKGTRANRLYVGNNACYVAGYGPHTNPVYADEGTEQAKLWPVGYGISNLSTTDNTVDNASEATDVINIDNTTWTIGREMQASAAFRPKLWINRMQNDIEKPGTGTRLNAITYENGIYYIAGNDGYRAKYWSATQKSETEARPANLTGYALTNGVKQGSVNDIAVLNSNVYCVGYEMFGEKSYQPKLWVNEEEKSLGLPANFNAVVPVAVCLKLKTEVVTTESEDQ